MAYNDNNLDLFLSLPNEFSHISQEQKLELLDYKRKNTVREWEEELFRWSERFKRKTDYEQLKRMLENGNLGNVQTRQPQEFIGNDERPTYKRNESNKRKLAELEDGEIFEDELPNNLSQSHNLNSMHNEGIKETIEAVVDEDEDDRLFDSDEEEEITLRVRNTGTHSLLEGTKKFQKLFSRLHKGDNDAKEDKDSDSQCSLEHEQFRSGDINISSIKLAHQRFPEKTEMKKGARSANFSSMAQYKHFLEEEMKKLKPPVVDDESKVRKENQDKLAERSDFIRCTLRRDDLLQKLSDSNGKDFIIGYFVRYLVDYKDRKPVYRLCQVVDVVDDISQPYKLPSTATTLQSSISTVHLILFSGDYSVDKRLRHFALDRISNRTILDEEVSCYLQFVKNYPCAFDGLFNRSISFKPVLTKNDISSLQQKRSHHVRNLQSANTNTWSHNGPISTTIPQHDVYVDPTKDRLLKIAQKRFSSELQKSKLQNAQSKSTNLFYPTTELPASNHADYRNAFETPDLEEIRKRVSNRLGVDPLSASKISPKLRYLQSVCTNLPPKSTKEREFLRGQNNRSIDDYLSLLPSTTGN